MGRASSIMKKFNENYELDSIGSVDVESIISNLYDKLESENYNDVLVDALLTTEGVAVYFSDESNNDVIVMFKATSDGFAKAMVIANDDEDQQMNIDLSALAPPVITDGATTYFDFSDLSWMNKSVLNALLKAGNVEEAETYILKGDQRIKLPIITIDDSDEESTFIANLVYDLKPDWFEGYDDSEVDDSELED